MASTYLTANFTRPNDTTAYASGDLVANSTTAGSVTPLTYTSAASFFGQFYIRRARLKKSGTSVTNASFRVHFYGASPTCANGDNAAWSTTESTYYGAADVTVDQAFSNGAKGVGAPNSGTEIPVEFTQGSAFYCLIEARGSYTPAAQEVFTLELELWRVGP